MTTPRVAFRPAPRALPRVVPEPEPGPKLEMSDELETQFSELTQTMLLLTAAIGEFMQRPPYTVVMPQPRQAMIHEFVRDETGRVTGAIVRPYDE